MQQACGHCYDLITFNNILTNYIRVWTIIVYSERKFNPKLGIFPFRVFLSFKEIECDLYYSTDILRCGSKNAIASRGFGCAVIDSTGYIIAK